MAKEQSFKPGIGVDVGTSNIVVTRQTADGSYVNKTHRNMLYPLEASDEAADLLKRSNYFYVQSGEQYFIIGEDALRLVNAIGRGEIVRPMKDGIMNPSLKQSSDLLFFILKAIVGKPIVENEPLRFSLPANPVDCDLHNLFHQMVLKDFFTKLGYSAKPVNEAMAICFNEEPVMKPTNKDDQESPLSGISCSCGGGMWNVALAYKGLSLVEFSCTKSGDFLDEQVAKATGVSKNKVLKIKEKLLNLDKIDESDRVQVALGIYYQEMIERMIHHICTQFKSKSSEMEGEIEVVVAGGSSMAPGFCKKFEEVLKKTDMPFKIYQIRHSSTPFYSVGQGACLRAQADVGKQK